MATLIRRPNGNSTAGTSLFAVGGVPNWDCVNDTTADDDTTYVESRAPGFTSGDRYTIPDPGLSNVTINSVKIWYRVRKNPSALGNPIVRGLIRINATDYPGTGTTVSSTSWQEYSDTWNTNPSNGLAWTATSIDNFEIGISVSQSPYPLDNAQITQVWVEIIYTPSQTTVTKNADTRVAVIRSFGVSTDILTAVTRDEDILSDMWLSVTTIRELLSDTRITVTRSISKTMDMLSVITRNTHLLIDMGLSVIRAVDTLFDTIISITRRPSPASPSVPASRNPALEYLGKGLRFPFTFQRRSGGAQISTATSSDHAHIHESIRQILGTRKGERLMRPEFGTRLHELVFEPNDHILYGLLRHEVVDALERWEPRIDITDVIIQSTGNDGHTVMVDIRYRLISSQVEGNMVYPFWRELE